MTKCERCGRRIPAQRLKLLPGTRRCIRCSDEKPKTDKDVPVAESSGDCDNHKLVPEE